jgi:hypothetical protein
VPTFTIETTYHLPIYRHRHYEADTLIEACRLAIKDDGWSDEKSDTDNSGETYVSGVWQGLDAAYRAPALLIPSQFSEAIRRKADHFETLLTATAPASSRNTHAGCGTSIICFVRSTSFAAAISSASARRSRVMAICCCGSRTPRARSGSRGGAASSGRAGGRAPSRSAHDRCCDSAPLEGEDGRDGLEPDGVERERPSAGSVPALPRFPP